MSKLDLRKSPGLIHGTAGRDLFHDLPPAAVSAHRQSAADDLAQTGQVRLDAEGGLRSAETEATV